MPAKTSKETFLILLSHVRQGAEKAVAIDNELSTLAENPHVKEALEARAFVSQNVVAKSISASN